ncbi:MAG: alpha/beta hydrolase [Bacteroidia bacterium]
MALDFFRLITRAADTAIRIRGFRREFIEANGSWQHYYVGLGKGSLPPVVLIHGLSGDATDLAPMYGPLRKHFKKVIVPDLPGHGRSQPPIEGMKAIPTFETFARGLDQILREPSFLLGNSLGGLAAIRYANHNPEMVKGIVLYSPGGAQVSLRELIVFKNKFRTDTRQDVRNFLNMLVTRAPWYRRMVENVLRNRLSQPAVMELLSNVTPDILLKPEEVASIPTPTLFIWGKADTLMGSQVNFFKQHLPSHAEIAEPDHFAHCPFIDQPKDCTRYAIEFATALKMGTGL